MTGVDQMSDTSSNSGDIPLNGNGVNGTNGHSNGHANGLNNSVDSIRSGASTPTSASGSVNGSVASSRRSSVHKDSFNRLFGPAEEGPRRVRDHMKSSIFAETVPATPASPAKKKIAPVRRNPITGEVLEEAIPPQNLEYGSNGNQSPSSASSDTSSVKGLRQKMNSLDIVDKPMVASPIYNGLLNGNANGNANGTQSQPTTPSHRPVRARQPPGGKSSIFF